MTNIVIDQNSGFCAGVINAIRTAEEWLKQEGSLYCLGDIVHNSEETQRLADMGLRVITHEEFR
ncbi:MAG: 4-hydroxy-3-methylbut-2-enyl diphosphate reductase, partial [Bacteroidales bacterium]|nr:4-hydroxy-3-methylbut-2-enyl diphosphate reductase [Bacteroidales bacterium]